MRKLSWATIILWLFLCVAITLLVACTPFGPSQRASQDSKQELATDQTAKQDARMKHEENGANLPIMIQCIQINTGKGGESPCWNREGTNKVGIP